MQMILICKEYRFKQLVLAIELSKTNRKTDQKITKIDSELAKQISQSNFYGGECNP